MLVVVVGLIGMGPAQAFAADPITTGIDGSAQTTPTPAELGYTVEYQHAKEQAANQRIAAFTLGGVATASSLSAASLPTSDSLAGFVNYHQKTTYNCLPAIGQSILHRDLDALKNNYFITPSVAARQGTASQGAGTITKGMNTNSTTGTTEVNAFSYINGQYAAAGLVWRYVAWDATQASFFQNRIVDEIGNLNEALYVRVNLASKQYAWSTLTHVTHATAAIAYTSAGAYTTIADPFTHLSSGTCTASGYTSTPDTSCNWVNYSTNKYYLSRDKIDDANPIYW
jgi:hypothetical protein